MKIAIHPSGGFAGRWIVYCREKSIPYKIVNCYDNTIIKQLEDCDALMWHFSHANPKDFLFAKQLLYAIQLTGKKVFPDFHTIWHFDDKTGQKYLLEAIHTPIAPTYVFYSKYEALDWLSATTFPKVFKLRSGAGSCHVKLVKTKQKASKMIKKMFGKGFSQYDKWGNLKERIYQYKKGKTTLFNVLKGVVRLIYPTDFAKIAGREKGYVYFQDFFPNKFDIRIVVVGNKAFGIKRMVRSNDFRASGSGCIIHRKSEIDERCVQIAFETNDVLQSQSVAYDFIYDYDNNPLIIEISYGFSPEGYEDCEGYWDKNLNWHHGSFNPYGWMIDNLLE